MAITDGIITLADAQASIYGASVTAPTGSASDLENYIEAATPVIEGIAGPVIGKTRVFTFDGGTSAVLVPVRWRTLTSVTVDGTATTAYVADAEAGIITALGRFSPGTQNVVVTVVVGYATSADYPPNVVLAARELVRFWWQQGRQGNRPSLGNEATPDSGAPLGFLVPKRVTELLQASPALGGFA